LIVASARLDPARQQAASAFVPRPVQSDLRLLGRGVRDHSPVIALHRLEDKANLGSVSLRIGQRDHELPRVQTVEDLAGGNFLVVMHSDVGHRSRDVGRDANLLRVHIRVVRVHDSSADDVPDAAGNQREWQQEEQNAAHPGPPLGLLRRIALLVRRRGPFLLRDLPGSLTQGRLRQDAPGFVERGIRVPVSQHSASGSPHS
jgi:hypothetical protein